MGRHSALLSVTAAMLHMLFLSTASAGATDAPRDESSWADLTDEPSRSDLFRDNIVPAYQADHPVSAEQADALAIPNSFHFPVDADFDRIKGKPRQNAIFCVDISHYTDLSLRLDELSSQSVRCVFAKATQGKSGKDGHFGTFWPALGELSKRLSPDSQKIFRGAFHFLSSSSPGRDQADAFVDYVNLHGGFSEGDLPPAIDLEWDKSSSNPDQWVGHTADEIMQNVLACLKRVKERTGRAPLVYTARSWWTSKTIPLARFSELKEDPIWIADYDPGRKLSEIPAVPSGVVPLIWQFTDRAQLQTGYERGLDASIFYGSEGDFKKKFGLAN